MDLLDDARSLQPDLVRLREDLHRVPEVGLQLPRTQERVLEELRGLPLEISTGSSTTSVTAVLRGTGSDAAASARPTVLLRGDMDALPIEERSGEDFAATNGAMHACGHDLHTAGLVGAAQLLSAHRDRLAGDVVFMFQPGEEGYDGARVMLDEGVLDASGRRPDHAYALHVVPHRLPAGLVSGRAGVTLFASYTLEVVVRGTGGHGATPHEAADPVVAAAEMVGALQTAVTRSFNASSPVIVTVGMLRAGTAANIIPDTARFEATVRTVDPDAEPRLRAVFTRCLEGIAAAHGVRVDVDLVAGYPATVNDAAEAEFAGGVVRELFGAEHYRAEEHPTQGSEDFSRVLQDVPGALLFLGAHAPGAVPENAAANHSPMARFDGSMVGRASALLAGLAAERLGA
ncbi:M20 family metallopeptidase [Saccharopolyspora sp. WRP15-2]|uniref:M20 family metallopeptidase n=1 Tax=Saccharopolyspora oryzae TaxID=2997343 RepID=A0ABT4UY20_9PSEU|nr:M20 family metallopeptidase [Saccharopolyspora oryzae]MDA3626607.1 M20 family metallopeptidase [Saccharopolyspora oryzae]